MDVVRVSAIAIVAIVATCTLGCRQILGFDEPTQTTSGDGADDSPLGDALDAPPGWLDPWTHRKAITILGSQVEVPTGGLVDFPVVVSVVDPEILATAQANGADIVFTTSDGTTRLASDVEMLGERLVVWVKVPNLSATDTRLYLYYGNPVAPPSDPTQTWSASYLGVWHLADNPGPGNAGDMRDATSGGRHATAAAAMSATDRVQGAIGLALLFDGVNAFLDFPTLDFGNTFTLSAWVNLSTTAGAGVKTMLANSAGNFNTNGFRWFINTAGTTDRRILFETGDGVAGSTLSTNANAIVAGAWTHIAVAVERSQGLARMFVDGFEVISGGAETDFMVFSDFELGRTEGGGSAFAGQLDELEVASTIRPAEWIRTAFNNQSSPSTFFTVGPQENR